MTEAKRKGLLGLPLLILLGAGVAWAGSRESVTVWGASLFALLVGLVFLIQWAAFIPAYLRETEKFFDLTGSLTYITVTVLGVWLNPIRDGRSYLLLLLILIWAVRLGAFLFRRIQKTGKDGRFDAIKPSFIRFLTTWTLQGVWVTFTLSAALVAITTPYRQALGLPALLGSLLWVCGFTIEVIADAQKSRFRADPRNRDAFIQSGLWAWSRHPNYFGEIVLWIGIAWIALPVLRGWQWVTLLSPVFVALLLTRISGIPLLEKRADKKWGGQAAYEAYKARTPLLIPRPPSSETAE